MLANPAIFISQYIENKVKDYGILIKFKLNITVVFSAVVGYLVACKGTFTYTNLLMLFIGGFAITGAANALNQVLEKDYDKLMQRTANRPLPTDRMSITEAVLIAGLMAVTGISIIWYFFNDIAALIGAISMLLYAFVYTPLKRLSPIAVFVGAIPGALPPLIGWVAATGHLDYLGCTLFATQFLWQFPHFWAIGWLGFDEYKKAGFKMLPDTGKSKETAIQAIIYIIGTILVNVLLVIWHVLSLVSLVAILICGAIFVFYGYNLYKNCDNKSALQLMFASLIYLTVTQTVMIIDSMIY